MFTISAPTRYKMQ